MNEPIGNLREWRHRNSAHRTDLTLLRLAFNKNDIYIIPFSM